MRSEDTVGLRAKNNMFHESAESYERQPALYTAKRRHGLLQTRQVQCSDGSSLLIQGDALLIEDSYDEPSFVGFCNCGLPSILICCKVPLAPASAESHVSSMAASVSTLAGDPWEAVGTSPSQSRVRRRSLENPK